MQKIRTLLVFVFFILAVVIFTVTYPGIGFPVLFLGAAYSIDKAAGGKDGKDGA